MENYCPQEQRNVLSMNLSCCAACPEKLKRKLLKMRGVHSVAIDTGKNLAFVTGRVDAKELIDRVEKLGKSVELVSSDDHPISRKNTQAENEGDHHHRHRTYKEASSSTARQSLKKHRNYCCCCYQGCQNRNKVEEEHKCEPYEIFKINPRVCRDMFCKVHPRSYKIVDTVPRERGRERERSFPLASFGAGNPFRGSYLNPGWQYGVGDGALRFGYYPHEATRFRGPSGFH